MTSPSIAPVDRVAVPMDALTEDAVRSVAAGEPDWLVDRRLAATKRYLDQSWPDSRKDEFWRSTPFAKRFDTSQPLVAEAGRVGAGSESAEGAVPRSLVASLELATAQLRIVDGEVVEAVVPTELAKLGVVVTDLRTAADEYPDLVRDHLGSLTTSGEGSGANEDRTVSVNDAAWTAGAFIHVPAEVELTAPIGVHVHVTREGAHLPRVLAIVGHHAKATVYLEHTSNEGVTAIVDEVVEVIAQDAAKVDVVSLHEWAMGVSHLSLQKIGAHRDAQVRHAAIVAGGATVRLRPECDLLGPGAQVRPLGIYYADEGQWFDLQPYVRHFAPRATSDVLYKGALQGNSRTVFRGNVFVHKDAVGTVTDENNRSLILTEGARADATPFLEIECADITAGHGSATGQIDARHLFYLEARGIPRPQALRMLVHGFFREVLTEIDQPGIEARALAHIERELAATDLDALGINDAALRDESV